MPRTLARPGTRLAGAERSVLRRLSVPVWATAILASLTLSASPAQAADCAGANLLPAIASVPTTKAATLCLLNNERAARGLGPLSDEPTLEAAATAYSHAMVRQRFFAHVSPGGQTLAERLASYVGAARSWVTGENLAWGEGGLATPGAIVRGWMQSPSHRDNILKGAFDEIGIGIVGGTPSGGLPAVSATYTTHFGARTLGTSGGSTSPLTAGAASTRPATKKQKSTRISAKKKKQISRRCHRVARRTKASTKTRQKRYDRCMRTEVRAAQTRQAASKKCHGVSRRTKASKKTRKARYDRCMRSELRAAKKRQATSRARAASSQKR